MSLHFLSSSSPSHSSSPSGSTLTQSSPTSLQSQQPSEPLPAQKSLPLSQPQPDLKPLTPLIPSLPASSPVSPSPSPAFRPASLAPLDCLASPSGSASCRPKLAPLQQITPTHSATDDLSHPAHSPLVASDHHNSHPSSESVSRASSARSTSSVQAVPFRTPNRPRPSTSANPNSLSYPALPAFMIPSVSPAPLERSSTRSPSPSSGPDLSACASYALGPQPPPMPALSPLPLFHTLRISPDDASAAPVAVAPDLRGRPPSRQLPVPPPDRASILARPAVPPARSPSGGGLSGCRKGLHDFHVGEILGEGSYSTVYHATDKSPPHLQYALKVLDKRHIQKEKKIKYVAVERDTLNRLDHHPGCLRLYSTFQDECSLYYLLEYAAKGEILKAIKSLGSFSISCARFYSAQVLSAIEHMHNRGVIHRDIKPENILLDADMRIKMADFGSAKILAQSTSVADGAKPAEERSHSFVGTAEYVSPELLIDKVTSKSSDLWAFGCVIFQMLSGTPPFRSRSEYLTFQKITHLDYQFPPGFPELAKDLISRLLVLDPTRRLGAGGLAELKAHAFFEGVEWESLWDVEPPPLEPGLVVAMRQPELALVPVLAEAETSASASEPEAALEPEAEMTGQLVWPATGHLDAYGPEEPPPTSAMATGAPPRNKFENAVARHKAWLVATAGRRKTGGGKEEAVGESCGAGELTGPGERTSGLSWVDVFLPNELMVYSSAVVEHRRQGLKKRRKRQLVLTDFPRLLCVKEEGKAGAWGVKVKHEVLFKKLPDVMEKSVPSGTTGRPISGHAGGRMNTQEDAFLIYRAVELENPRTFRVETDGRESTKVVLRFEDRSDDTAERWTAEIKLAYEKANQEKVKKKKSGG